MTNYSLSRLIKLTFWRECLGKIQLYLRELIAKLLKYTSKPLLKYTSEQKASCGHQRPDGNPELVRKPFYYGLYNYLELNSLISDRQYCFRGNRNTGD